MNKELQTKSQSPINTIRALLERSKTQIAMALPKHLNADRIIRVAMTSIQRTPQLLECDPISLVAAVIQSSQLGLEPDGILGHAYLVPFRNTKKNRMEVQFIPGYKGLIDLARRSGQVNRISAHVVYDNEPFVMEYGTKEVLEHKPLPPSTRGNRKGVYAVAVLNDGSAHFEWLWDEEIEAVKRQSKAASFGPWKTHEDEMVRKTAIRRLVKYLPLSVELAKAAAIDELADAGVSTAELFEDIDAAPVTTQEPAGKSIDEAFSQMQQPAPEIAEETTVKQPETENKSEKTSSEDQLFAILDLIDGYKIGPGALTAYVVRALRQNKPKDLWTADEAAKVLEEIRKTKGGN
jgi:recombination protein RecT